jgi:hypothetical protein
MRSNCIIPTMFICFGHIHSPDTIHFNGKGIERVKIVKISAKDIEYNRFDNMDGAAL